MNTHELKVWNLYFFDLLQGNKNFEVRKNDRGFQVGDILVLKEWNDITKEYTGMECTRRVQYILHGGQFGIEMGYCVMGLVYH